MVEGGVELPAILRERQACGDGVARQFHPFKFAEDAGGGIGNFEQGVRAGAGRFAGPYFIGAGTEANAEVGGGFGGAAVGLSTIRALSTMLSGTSLAFAVPSGLVMGLILVALAIIAGYNLFNRR